MSQHPVTRPSLLLRLRDGTNDRAWSQFFKTYAPLIRGYCQRKGLQPADASDVVQEVLLSVFNAMGDFDYSTARGRFRGWLLTVASSKVNDYFRRLNRYKELCNAAAVLQDSCGEGSNGYLTDWERESRRVLFEQAALRVRGEVSEGAWKAFEATRLQGRSAREVASELGLSVGAVYLATGRVKARLKQAMAAIGKDGGTC